MHGYELRTALAELADDIKHQQPTQTALFNRNQQLDVDTDQEAAERTIIGWYHKRDFKRTSDVAGLGLLAERLR